MPKRKKKRETSGATGIQLRAIIDNALDAIVIMNSDGRITAWNPQAQAIFGWTKKEALGHRMSKMIIPPHYREAHEKGLKRFFSTGEGPVLNKRLELTALHKNGHEFPIELTVTATKLAENWTFSGFLRDITERKKTIEDLKKANKELVRLSRIKSDFTSMVSHELRTPLNAIKEGINIVLEGIDGPLTGGQSETLGIAKNNADRLGRLVNNVLDYSRLEAGKMKLDLQKISLNKLVREVYDLMKQGIEKKPIAFLQEIPSKTVEANCDEELIKQVLINLVNNAVKFTEKGKIILRLDLVGKEAKMEVEDTGLGIDKEDLPHIFEMFSQGHYRGMWKTGGSGVGLAVCRLVMDLHRGKVSVKSKPGSGSLFTVTFPLQ